MQKTLKEIAAYLGGEVMGNPALVVSGVSGIKEARPGEITFLANPKYLPLLEKTLATAVITSRDVIFPGKALVHTENPSLAFSKAVTLFCQQEIVSQTGIHASVSFGKNVTLGKNVSIGPFAVVEDECTIGDNVRIYPGCFIGHHGRIGRDTLIYPNVSIRENVTVGSRVIIHSGTVIGSDGFGFVSIEGLHHKIPQVGTVEIGDDVEIGANVTIDRARFDKTIIGNGTKIDNLVQIAHNVEIGENSIIVSQVGISGSTIIGKNVTLAGQVGIVGHVQIGDKVIVMAQSGVSKSLPEGSMVWGYPAKPVNIAKRVNASVQNLPRLYRTVSELKKKIEELEKKLNG